MLAGLCAVTAASGWCGGWPGGWPGSQTQWLQCSGWPGAQPGSRNTVGSHQSATVQYGGGPGRERVRTLAQRAHYHHTTTTLPLNWARPGRPGGCLVAA